MIFIYKISIYYEYRYFICEYMNIYENIKKLKFIIYLLSYIEKKKKKEEKTEKKKGKLVVFLYSFLVKFNIIKLKI